MKTRVRYTMVGGTSKAALFRGKGNQIISRFDLGYMPELMDNEPTSNVNGQQLKPFRSDP